MKYVAVAVGQKIELSFDGHVVSIVPQQKSGSRMHLGIDAGREVEISNAINLVDDGVVDK